MTKLIPAIALVAALAVSAGCKSTSPAGANGGASAQTGTTAGGGSMPNFSVGVGKKIGYDYTSNAGGQAVTGSWVYEITNVAGDDVTATVTTTMNGKTETKSQTSKMVNGYWALPGTTPVSSFNGMPTEKVTVKAGTFDAYKVTSTTTAGSTPGMPAGMSGMSYTYWFSGAVMVKSVMDYGGVQTTMELSTLQ
jgi:hypothetical protein